MSHGRKPLFDHFDEIREGKIPNKMELWVVEDQLKALEGRRKAFSSRQIHVLYGFHSQLIENMEMGVAPTVLTACASLVWKVFRDCIPTKAFLYARGLALRCQRCNDEAEYLQHLLFHSS